MRAATLVLLLYLVARHALAQKPHVSCDKKYKKVGCFSENKSFALLFTDRSLYSSLNFGHLIDWNNWNDYIHSFACRCDQHAIANGFDYFALRYYGVCYGAKAASAHKAGLCLSQNYESCTDSSDEECVGVSFVDYIYEVGRDGGLSNWAVIAPCSTTCGNGTQIRERACTNPTPSGYGKNCTKLGPTTEVVSCSSTPCKVDGGFSNWSAYGSCSKTCGGGIQSRQRQCNNPSPLNGGRNCDGAFNESRSCNSELCPVDGGFSNWSAYGSCSKSCGGGIQTRQRECNNPAPVSGGRNCGGAFNESRPCNNELCPGAAGISMAQEIVENYLIGFYNSTYPSKTPSGKFRLAIFAIQQAVANEMAFGTVKENLQQRLSDLRKFLKVAAEGGSIDFARSTLGKSLFVFMKMKIAEGLLHNGTTTSVNDFLKSIKDDIGEQKFNELMLADGGATLIFAVDTTGSMADEIAAARGIANAIMNMPRRFPVDYILSPFNDPGYGPITHKNESNKNEFITAMETLPIRGGGDCPELAFTGMLEAYKANPLSGSPMFVFTDASASDDTPENVENLKTEAAQHDSAITFFTNQIGCGKGIQSYKDIASYTSGQIFPLKNHEEIRSFTNYVKTNLMHSVTIAKGRYTPTFGRKRQLRSTSRDLFVEAEVDILQVSIEVMATGSTSAIVLENPSSTAATADATNTYTKVYNINNPSPGRWKLTVPIFVGEYSYTAKLFCNKTIDFATYFLHQERKSGPVISLMNPLSGPKLTLAVQISETELLDLNSLRIGITDERGQIIDDNIIPNTTGEAKGILQAIIKTPDRKFRVALSGTTRGFTFQRLSRTSFEASDLAMVPIKGGDEYTASVRKASSKILLYVYNGGRSDVFSLSTTTSLGSVSSSVSQFNLDKGQNTTLSINLHPQSNPGSTIGKSATVTITATGRSSAKRFQFEVKMLWVP